jgi:hypothetical protein
MRMRVVDEVVGKSWELEERLWERLIVVLVGEQLYVYFKGTHAARCRFVSACIVLMQDLLLTPTWIIWSC